MSMINLPKATVPGRPGLRSEVTENAVKRWNPDIKASAEKDSKRSISVLDPIGEDLYGNGVTAKRVAAALRLIGDGDVIVNINSPGGDFFEGLAIYNLLREHPGDVTVKVLGMAASAASLIAMAGNNILMARASFLMIHNTWVLAAGDRHALRDVADWLQPFDDNAISIYAARTGLTSKELGKMLDRETWIGGEASIDQGFADGFLEADEVDASIQNLADITEVGAQKKVDLLLATGARATKSERRHLVAALKKGGKSSAAPTGMSGAAVKEVAQAALDKLSNI